MPLPTRRRRPVLLIAGALLLLALGAWGGRTARSHHGRPATAAAAASLRTFAGTWMGHTRGLYITKRGQAYEQLGDGCCDEVVHMHFQLSDPRGTPQNATALVRVTSIQLLNAKDYRADPKYKIKAAPKPFVGKTARLHLRSGVITEPLDGFNTTYCGSRAEAKGVCGA